MSYKRFLFLGLMVLALALAACGSTATATTRQPPAQPLPPAPQPASGCKPTLVLTDPGTPPPDISQKWVSIADWPQMKAMGSILVFTAPPLEPVKVTFDQGGKYVAEIGKERAEVSAQSGQSVELGIVCGNAALKIFLKFDGTAWFYLKYAKKDPQA